MIVFGFFSSLTISFASIVGTSLISLPVSLMGSRMLHETSWSFITSSTVSLCFSISSLGSSSIH